MKLPTIKFSPAHSRINDNKNCSLMTHLTPATLITPSKSTAPAANPRIAQLLFCKPTNPAIDSPKPWFTQKKRRLMVVRDAHFSKFNTYLTHWVHNQQLARSNTKVRAIHRNGSPMFLQSRNKRRHFRLGIVHKSQQLLAHWLAPNWP